MAKIFFRLP